MFFTIEKLLCSNLAHLLVLDLGEREVRFESAAGTFFTTIKYHFGMLYMASRTSYECAITPFAIRIFFVRIDPNLLEARTITT